MHRSWAQVSTLALSVALSCTSKSSDDSSDDAADDAGTAGSSVPATFGSPSGEDEGDDDGVDDGPGDDAPGDGTDDADDDDDAGAGFVMRVDGGGANECDPKAQDCEMGQKCTAWANDGGTFWNANRCVDVSGNGVAGDSCVAEGGGVAGLDDCDVGFICMNTDDENMGSCTQFCAGEDDDCELGNVCAIYNDGVLPICLRGCDPLLQDCGEGESCIDTPNQTFICFTDASGAGGAAGEACPPEHGENSCDPGNWCGAGAFGCADVNCCTPFCDVSEDDCVSPNVCTTFYGDANSAPPGLEDVGVCVVP